MSEIVRGLNIPTSARASSQSMMSAPPATAARTSSGLNRLTSRRGLAGMGVESVESEVAEMAHAVGVGDLRERRVGGPRGGHEGGVEHVEAGHLPALAPVVEHRRAPIGSGPQAAVVVAVALVELLLGIVLADLAARRTHDLGHPREAVLAELEVVL